MALTDAWAAAGRGSGVVVAVVDSGVDASVPTLSGRVSEGVDVVTGTESGTTDCLGTGTAMAALIVGDDPEFLLGVAPDATVAPIRGDGRPGDRDPDQPGDRDRRGSLVRSEGDRAGIVCGRLLARRPSGDQQRRPSRRGRGHRGAGARRRVAATAAAACRDAER